RGRQEDRPRGPRRGPRRRSPLPSAAGGRGDHRVGRCGTGRLACRDAPGHGGARGPGPHLRRFPDGALPFTQRRRGRRVSDPRSDSRRPRVVVTQGEGAQGSLAAALIARGAEVLALPAIAIEPPSDLAPLDTALAQLDGFDWMLFTRREGVEAGWRVPPLWARV